MSDYILKLSFGELHTCPWHGQHLPNKFLLRFGHHYRKEGQINSPKPQKEVAAEAHCG